MIPPVDNMKLSGRPYIVGAHEAMDIAPNVPAHQAYGVPVRSPEAGIVEMVGNNPHYIGGLYVRIKGVETGWIHYLGHNQKNLVRVGQRVAKGQQVAELGATGTQVSGPHVHWQIMHNVPGNPSIPQKEFEALFYRLLADQNNKKEEVEMPLTDTDAEFKRVADLHKRLTGNDLSRDDYKKGFVGQTWQRVNEMIMDSPLSQNYQAYLVALQKHAVNLTRDLEAARGTALQQESYRILDDLRELVRKHEGKR